MRIENTTTHQIDLSINGKTTSIPAAQEIATGVTINGSGEALGADVKKAREIDPAIQYWFESGELVVADETDAPSPGLVEAKRVAAVKADEAKAKAKADEKAKADAAKEPAIKQPVILDEGGATASQAIERDSSNKPGKR